MNAEAEAVVRDLRTKGYIVSFNVEKKGAWWVGKNEHRVTIIMPTWRLTRRARRNETYGAVGLGQTREEAFWNAYDKMTLQAASIE